MGSNGHIDTLSWADGEAELAFGILEPDAIETPDNQELFERALSEQVRIERGEHVNTDEDRQVGHYWLRAPDLASSGVGQEISAALEDIVQFSNGILAERTPEGRQRWTDAIVIGIGGSSLGAAFVSQALGLERRFDSGDGHVLSGGDPSSVELS